MASAQEEIIRGNDAAAILRDPLVVSALSEMESAVVDRIALCPPENEKLQAKLCMMLGVIRSFRQIFQAHVETGQLAMASFDQEKKRRFGVF